MNSPLYRQGDVLIRRIAALPTNLTPRKSSTLVEGEVTGHMHRVETLDATEVYEVGSSLYLRVGEEGVRIIHEEHAPIMLPGGNYEVFRQIEYSPSELRNVAD